MDTLPIDPDWLLRKAAEEDGCPSISVGGHAARCERDRVLLVGELNPYGADPAFALYPSPEGSAGYRLAHFLCDRRSEYMQRFDRANLCAGSWSNSLAREAAEEIMRRRTRVVALGAKVARAFGVSFSPFARQEVRHPHGPATVRVLVLPHPSGRCRLWGEPGAPEQARQLVADLEAL